MTTKYTRKMNAIKAGEKAEHEACAQFKGCKRVTDMNLQKVDIDLVFRSKDSAPYFYSVKDQVTSSKKYGGITVEMELSNPKTGKKMPGNFVTCKAHSYIWKVWYDGKAQWLMFDHSTLAWYMEHYDFLCSTKELWPQTVAENEAQGRKYTQTTSKSINLTQFMTYLDKKDEGLEPQARRSYKLVEVTV